MITLRISYTSEDAQRFCEVFPERTLRGTVRAMNRGIGSGRTLMTQLIARDTGLKSSYVREQLRLQQATFSRPEVQLAAPLKRIPLSKFKFSGPEPSRGRGRGVSYRIGRVSNRLATGFIATMDSGHRGVFIRPEGSQRRSQGAWGKNLPIIEPKGPSLGQVFDRFQGEVRARIEEQTRKNLDHELQFAAQGLSLSAVEGADA